MPRSNYYTEPYSAPLSDAHLGKGFMRVTTAWPEDNARFVAALRDLLVPEAAR